MKLIRSTLALFLISLVAACATSSGGAGSRSNTSVLTAEEIQAAGFNDAFSAVQSMRPQWLRVRGSGSMSSREQVQVYLDGSRLGGTDQLRSIATSSINRIQYYDGLEASQRYGLGHGAGAIVVTTRGRS
jgi:hypothetical protein